MATSRAISSFKYWYQEKIQKVTKIRQPLLFNSNMPIGYFDGASHDNGNKCGVGVILILINGTMLKIRFGYGQGTNTMGELLAL